MIADVKRLWSTSTRRYKLVFGAAAIGVTSMLITIFILESRWGVLPEGPQIVYAADWPVTRSDAEIKAQQHIDAVEKRKQADERRHEWQKLDKKLTSMGL